MPPFPYSKRAAPFCPYLLRVLICYPWNSWRERYLSPSSFDEWKETYRIPLLTQYYAHSRKWVIGITRGDAECKREINKRECGNRRKKVEKRDGEEKRWLEIWEKSRKWGRVRYNERETEGEMKSERVKERKREWKRG